MVRVLVPVESRSKSYYVAHRSEILARAKVRRDANADLYRERGRKAARRWRERNLELCRERGREAARRWRERNPVLNRKRHIGYFRKWRDSHRDKHRAIRNAQQTVPLGDYCELCGCEGDLMRFLVDYDYPKIVVTVCRECRGLARRSLRVLEGIVEGF
jgi:hypothetical protein